MRTFGRIFSGFIILIVVLVAGALFSLRWSDGPVGPLAGGELRDGALVTSANIDWAKILDREAEKTPGEAPQIELQLVNPQASRITGVLMYDGDLYVPCDLGFIWNRFPPSTTRRILHTIYIVKRWHKDAQSDGRAVLRIDGKRYERQLVRITDPQQVAALKSSVNEGLADLDLAEALGAAPKDGPNDIWFFRVDPRPDA
jgi:hypothetical protein